jgi:hypothetical protein
MSEYILEDLSKITWGDLFNILILVLIFMVMVGVITLIRDKIKKNKREEKLRICLPYKIKYEELLENKKYKEALKFAEDNNKYLKEVYYFW